MIIFREFCKPTLRNNMEDGQKVYEVRLRLLGNEVFAVSLSASDTSNRLLALGLVTVFCILTIIGAYGTNLVELYRSLVG